MAARTTSLVLDISANISGLNNDAKAARSALASIRDGAESVEAAVRQAFTDMVPANSARQAERQFTQMFKQIEANARSIAAETSQEFGLKLFDLGAADEQVRALTTQAAQLRANAAQLELAAKEGGEFAVRQQEMAVAVQASAVRLENEAKALDDTASALRSAGVASAGNEAALARTTRVSGSARAGMQQLSFQLNDVAVQFASGTPPMTIFAQQGGQVIQAIQLMSGESKGLLGFLAGPWGIVLTSAAVVLAPLVAKLFDAGDAAKEAKAGADALGQAQSVLGGIFDLTTGKIKSQNEMLRLNARLMAINLRGEALKEGASSAKTFRDSGRQSTGDFILGAIAADLPGRTAGEANAIHIQALVNAMRAGSITPEQLLKRSERLDFTGTKVTREQFQQAVIDAASSTDKSQVADLIDQSLDSGKLAPGLERPKTSRPHKPKADHSAEIAARQDKRFDDAIGQAQGSMLDALLGQAQTGEQRLALQLAQLEDDKKSRELHIDDQVKTKELTAAQAEQLKARWAAVDIVKANNLKAAEHQRELDQQLQVDREELDGKISVLRMQSQFADTLEERRRIALQILELELQERRDAANRLLQSNNADDRAEGSRQLAQIDREAPLLRQQVQRDNEDPLEQYLEHIRQAAGDTKTALKQVEADGLQSLEDGLVGVISGTESVASAFKKMAASIIADLARIAIEKLIVKTIGGSFFGFAEGGPVLTKATGGFISGPGSGTSDSIPAMLSNGEFVVNASATARFMPLLTAINDGKVPHFANGGRVSLPRLPSAALLQTPGGGPAPIQQHFHVDARGAVLAEQLVSEMQKIGTVAAVGGSRLAQQDFAEQQASALF